MSFKCKLLSIDGGGIRGIIPAMILAEIEKRTGKRTSEMFDLVAGTSTGGILSLGLTKPDPQNPNQPEYTAQDLVELYLQEGERIFYEPPLEKLTKIDDFLRPKYSSDGRSEVLAKFFADSPIKDALKPVFITSYDTELRMPIFFISQEGAEKQSKFFRKIRNGFTMKDAAMATSAAPTFFKPHKILTDEQTNNIDHDTKRGYYSLVDGGVFANNPTSLAIMEARIYAKETGKKLDLSDMLVVSLGTGSLMRKYHYNQAENWGLLNWLEPLINILMDGQSESVSTQLEQLLDCRQYYRFQEWLTKAKDDMDDATPGNMALLQEQATEIIKNRDADLDNLCNDLAGKSQLVAV
jgi:uncharacterized protein